ncbi:MAG: hypothetical protein IH595_09590 [Bacteroidales bacterium]|nr:hypothetical protein [Bacteroidales bacterium]
MKKYPLRYGVSAVIISILFFIFGGIDLIHLFFGKILLFHSHVDVTSAAYKFGYAVGHFARFYVVPIFLVFTGWLLFKLGSEKVKQAHME